MGESAFRREDRVGLAAAIGLHIALVAALALQFLLVPADPVMPPRMTVSLATEVSLQSTAPDPAPDARAALAPTLSEEPAPEVQSDEADATPDAPPPVPSARAEPRPSRESPSETRRPADTRETASRPRQVSNAGGSRIGEDFLEGQGSSATSDDTRTPAAAFGASERAALSSAITRQLRPHWNAPDGVDAEKLVSIVSWRLNEDGSLSGRPSCRNQSSSITASNRPQAGLHCERAIRAVQLAAPFNLPEQFYNRWKQLEWQFDRRL